ncbi:ORF377 [White spot syndrome virus]|uniref:Wsv348 n=3 Tax=White spot syndrome virus TaxID=342409 RepID=Q8VAQ3_WSSVS|nr:wsv348 [Shrimp white spot syndrome virus]AFX59725.1 wsv348 [White spot syndrome virus]AAL33350.1 wsv348 [Shrimp white spot syndrome virus]AAL89272.1 WSSV404 [Shrimp white spot syndrome virus]ATU83796.1 ORF377 [White spot syndrome virus]AWQ60477.1 wsv348 [Shrimp white spot syndrome virus]
MSWADKDDVIISENLSVAGLQTKTGEPSRSNDVFHFKRPLFFCIMFIIASTLSSIFIFCLFFLFLLINFSFHSSISSLQSFQE